MQLYSYLTSFSPEMQAVLFCHTKYSCYTKQTRNEYLYLPYMKEVFIDVYLLFCS